MKQRVKRNSTGLYFDSFKHLKNNISNLATTELLTLYNSSSMIEYANLKPVNYKSKLPDMKKIGLVEYTKLRSNEYKLSEEGLNIYKIIKEYEEYFRYPTDTKKRIKTVSPEYLLSILEKSQLEEFRYNILKLLLSYFDTADYIRPYLLLIKTLENNGIYRLDNDILRIILAQSKSDILEKKFDLDAYTNLDESIKKEVNRPISYIKNFLKTSMIIDDQDFIIYDEDYIKTIIFELEEINLKSFIKSRKDSVRNQRPTNLQSCFRQEVLENFNYKCAISGEPIRIRRNNKDDIFILEAAHIVPYSEGGSFSYKNGIALTPELHKLFDLELFTFKYVDSNNLKVKVSDNNNIQDNGLLKKIDNKIINLSGLTKGAPDIYAIEYRSKKLM